MISLLLDSSTKVLYVAIVKDEEVLFEKYIEGKNNHAKNIVACINDGLNELNLKVDDLGKIVIGNGPGSYTGVRMAVTVGKMMAVFKDIPLYTISTLKLISSGYKGKVLALIDARRGNAFSFVYDYDKNEAILEEGLYSYETLKEYEVDYTVNEEYKVDPIYCVNNSILVNEPHLLVPNYLRDTEAERNLK